MTYIISGRCVLFCPSGYRSMMVASQNIFLAIFFLAGPSNGLLGFIRDRDRPVMLIRSDSLLGYIRDRDIPVMLIWF